MTEQPETPATQATESRRLETEVCSRCGGSGHYSYCHRYGTTCFKCHGSGKVYTKRGRAAFLFLEEIRSVPARELAAGDTIRAGSVTADGTPFGKFVKVLSITPETQRGSSLVDGVMTPWERSGLTIETALVVMVCVNPDSLIRKGWGPADKLVQFVRAMDYQETLTKDGKPRKRPARR